MSLAEWLKLANLRLWRNRMQPDYLANVKEYRAEFINAIYGMGRTGSFWQVG